MSTSSRVSACDPRRVVWLAGAVAVASLLAACGSAEPSQPGVTPSPSSVQSSQPSQTGTPAATVTPSTAPSAGTAPAACRTATLLISLDDSQADGTAGSAYYPLNFTNTAAAACEMYGFPGVSFSAAPSAAGRQIGLAAERTGAFAKVTVRLAPGATAHAWVKVSFAGDYPASLCQPVTAGWLRVYPPGETVAGYVAHAFNACSATGVTQLTVLPVRAGQGRAGVTP